MIKYLEEVWDAKTARFDSAGGQCIWDVQAAANLGELASQMKARVDQLALDLANKSSDGDTGRARAYLTALRGVLANAGPKLTAASLPTLCETFNGLVDMAADNEELHVWSYGALHWLSRDVRRKQFYLQSIVITSWERPAHMLRMIFIVHVLDLCAS